MKILIVSSGNIKTSSPELHHVYMREQIKSLKDGFNIEVDDFFIKGKGIIGYLKNFPSLKKKIKSFSPDIIHAHYGLSGLLSVLQRKVPVITTFHNGETLSLKSNFLSSIVPLLSVFDIYVAKHIRKKMFYKKKNYAIIPCGVDFRTIRVLDNPIILNRNLVYPNKKNIIFCGSFENERKNFDLAKKAIALLTEYDINLIELKGLARDEVNQLLNICDLALSTSKSEGSPQFIKEAMACNCPIVATDVGDIREVISNTEGCYITSFDPSDVANKISLALQFSKKTNGREKIKHLDNNIIAKKIFDIYQTVINK